MDIVTKVQRKKQMWFGLKPIPNNRGVHGYFQQIVDGDNLDVAFTFYIKTKKKTVELCAR
jgi:hypothetical protein